VSDLCNYDGLDGGERNVGCWRGRTDRRVQAGTPSVASEAGIESNREEREMSTGQFGGQAPRIVSREEWLAPRLELLAMEKELTAMKDHLAAKRRRLPWVRVEKDYIFDGPAGAVTLSQLFDGRSQLFIKHFMMGPGQAQQCVGCSLEVDHLAGIRIHLEHHDLSYAVVARAPIQEIEQLRKHMGWDFTWVSSFHNDFNFDFNVSFTDAQLAAGRGYYNFREGNPGLTDLSGDSVFVKDAAGQVYHTYSTFGRGGEQFLGVYAYLDATPKGRAENGPYHSLPDWARPHNMYGRGGTVEGTGRYHAANCGCTAHGARAVAES
jgi:predicted dithiol-disulfide oxidoreductase (DUF899 family)